MKGVALLCVGCVVLYTTLVKAENENNRLELPSLKAEVWRQGDEVRMEGWFEHYEEVPVTLVIIDVNCGSDRSDMFTFYLGCDRELRKCDPIQPAEQFVFEESVPAKDYFNKSWKSCTYGIRGWVRYIDYAK